MYHWAGLSLQEGSSVIMELMIFFHDYMIVILCLIMGFVSYIFLFVIITKNLDKYVVESHFLELVWTLLPMVILVFMAFPSLYLLYLTEDVTQASISVKVVAHQWYWEYEYDLSSSNSFDSYILNFDGVSPIIRNLDVDNRLVLPSFISSLMLIGSADVLHSWTVPILGVKVDAIPGRLNYLTVTPSTSGVFYGQCSELCGSNHSFMPIVVERVLYPDFLSYLNSSSNYVSA